MSLRGVPSSPKRVVVKHTKEHAAATMIDMLGRDNASHPPHSADTTQTRAYTVTQTVVHSSRAGQMARSAFSSMPTGFSNCRPTPSYMQVRVPP